jgi:hypothetical protein
MRHTTLAQIGDAYHREAHWSEAEKVYRRALGNSLSWTLSI